MYELTDSVHLRRDYTFDEVGKWICKVWTSTWRCASSHWVICILSKSLCTCSRMGCLCHVWISSQYMWNFVQCKATTKCLRRLCQCWHQMYQTDGKKTNRQPSSCQHLAYVHPKMFKVFSSEIERFKSRQGTKTFLVLVNEGLRKTRFPPLVFQFVSNLNNRIRSWVRKYESIVLMELLYRILALYVGIVASNIVRYIRQQNLETWCHGYLVLFM